VVVVVVVVDDEMRATQKKFWSLSKPNVRKEASGVD